MKRIINITHIILMAWIYVSCFVFMILGIIKLIVFMVQLIYPDYANVNKITMIEIVVYAVSFVMTCDLYNKIKNGMEIISVPFKMKEDE